MIKLVEMSITEQGVTVMSPAGINSDNEGIDVPDLKALNYRSVMPTSFSSWACSVIIHEVLVIFICFLAGARV